MEGFGECLNGRPCIANNRIYDICKCICIHNKQICICVYMYTYVEMKCSYLSPDHIRLSPPLSAGALPTRPHDRPSHMICFGKAKHVGPNERRHAGFTVRQRRLDQPGCADVSDEDSVNLHLGWAWYSSPPIYIYIYIYIWIYINTQIYIYKYIYMWNMVELDRCIWI